VPERGSSSATFLGVDAIYARAEKVDCASHALSKLDALRRQQQLAAASTATVLKGARKIAPTRLLPFPALPARSKGVETEVNLHYLLRARVGKIAGNLFNGVSHC